MRTECFVFFFLPDESANSSFLLTYEISKSLSDPSLSLGDLLAHWFRSGGSGHGGKRVPNTWIATFDLPFFFLACVYIAVMVSLTQVIGDQTSYLPAAEAPG